jgi:hypothetical protein
MEGALRRELAHSPPRHAEVLSNVGQPPDLTRPTNWGNPKTRTFAELLIDCEEDRTLRGVLLGMLRERAEDILTRRRGRQKAGHMNVDLWS